MPRCGAGRAARYRGGVDFRYALGAPAARQLPTVAVTLLFDGPESAAGADPAAGAGGDAGSGAVAGAAPGRRAAVGGRGRRRHTTARDGGRPPVPYDAAPGADGAAGAGVGVLRRYERAGASRLRGGQRARDTAGGTGAGGHTTTGSRRSCRPTGAGDTTAGADAAATGAGDTTTGAGAAATGAGDTTTGAGRSRHGRRATRQREQVQRPPAQRPPAQQGSAQLASAQRPPAPAGTGH